MERLRKGGALVIWKLDRLGRSLRDLIDKPFVLQNRGIELISLQENVDTSTATGKPAFAIFVALSEFKRDIIRELLMLDWQQPGQEEKPGGVKNPSQKNKLSH